MRGLVVICGKTGTGKTTLATAIAARCGVPCRIESFSRPLKEAACVLFGTSAKDARVAGHLTVRDFLNALGSFVRAHDDAFFARSLLDRIEHFVLVPSGDRIVVVDDMRFVVELESIVDRVERWSCVDLLIVRMTGDGEKNNADKWVPELFDRIDEYDIPHIDLQARDFDLVVDVDRILTVLRSMSV